MGNKTAILSDDFIANINEFASEYIHKKDINDISLLSLDVLTKLPNFYCSSIYLIEDETYTFNFVAGKPANFNFEAQFEYLLVNESIGNALSGCEIVSYPCKSPGYTDYIVPILGYDGVLALVIAKFKNETELTEGLITKLSLFGSVTGSIFQSLFSLIDKQHYKEIQNQLIAVQTLELQKRQQHLKLRMEQLTSNLNKTIPHEIRTPILHILGLSDFLKSMDEISTLETGNDILDMIHDINFSAKRLNNLLDNYILYANLVTLSYDLNEIDKHNLMITEDLDSIVYELASEKAYATHRADDLSMELESRLVRGDHILLSKLFFEVIDNAFKFSEPNTKIEIKSYVKDNFYCVSVTDHGLGMDQVEIEAISPFVQFNRFEHEQQGIGLGLAIVIKILALYNGDIKIISEKGKYTVVIISLILAGES